MIFFSFLSESMIGKFNRKFINDKECQKKHSMDKKQYSRGLFILRCKLSFSLSCLFFQSFPLLLSQSVFVFLVEFLFFFCSHFALVNPFVVSKFHPDFLLCVVAYLLANRTDEKIEDFYCWWDGFEIVDCLDQILAQIKILKTWSLWEF